MTYTPPPLPVKPRNNVRTILIVVGIVLVLCCGGAVAGGFFLFKNVASTVAPAQDAITGYMDDLVAQDYPGAYQRLCGPVKNRITETSFANVQKDSFNVRSYSITNTSVRNMNGRVSATATVSATLTNGSNQVRIFPMVQEDGTWKICE